MGVENYSQWYLRILEIKQNVIFCHNLQRPAGGVKWLAEYIICIDSVRHTKGLMHYNGTSAVCRLSSFHRENHAKNPAQLAVQSASSTSHKAPPFCALPNAIWRMLNFHFANYQRSMPNITITKVRFFRVSPCCKHH